MPYKTLYRKFRPKSFADVKGQDHIVTTLKNQIKTGRIGHAYLFTGTRGTGKTTVAKIFARIVNCENPTEDGPCGVCKSCMAIDAGASMNVIEMDAASNNGIDSIRRIVDEVSYPPTEGKYKVYIIDEVQNVTPAAFNALLKTLEEPPSYVIFILATTEVNKLPVTILSRCQRFDFKRISIDTITARLQELMEIEGVDVEERALRYVARMADGSMRDALSLLDQCIAFHMGSKLTYDNVLDVLGAVDTDVFSRLLRYIIKGDASGCINLLDEVIMQGRELGQFVTDFTWYLRNLMLVQTSDDLEDVINVSSDNLARLKEEASMLDSDRIIRYIRVFSELISEIRYSSSKRILVEIALIKLCRPAMETDQDALLDRIRVLEEKVDMGLPADNRETDSAHDVPGEGKKNSGEVYDIKNKSVIPSAVPEDIKRIVSNWRSIVDGMDMPMSIYLKGAVLSLGEGNQLIVVLEDGLAADYFTKRDGNRERLEAVLSDFLGRTVNVDIRVASSRKEIDQNYADLSKVIHMEIEEED